jgi:hypothetical protein
MHTEYWMSCLIATHQTIGTSPSESKSKRNYHCLSMLETYLPPEMWEKILADAGCITIVKCKRVFHHDFCPYYESLKFLSYIRFARMYMIPLLIRLYLTISSNSAWLDMSTTQTMWPVQLRECNFSQNECDIGKK